MAATAQDATALLLAWGQGDQAVSHEIAPDVVALDEALTTLAMMEPRKAQVVELRFFGGLTVEETGEALHVSAVTVLRDWQFATPWLLREMSAR